MDMIALLLTGVMAVPRKIQDRWLQRRNVTGSEEEHVLTRMCRMQVEISRGENLKLNIFLQELKAELKINLGCIISAKSKILLL